MSEDKKERSCDTCKYFSRHYAWTENGFCAVNCGHCACIRRPIKERLKYAFVTVCKYWEDGESLIEERNKSILNAVKNMTDRLDEISIIFDDE